MSDNELNIKLRNGDTKAFEIIFKNYYSRLLAFARKFIDNPALAEDTVQDVFSNLWVKRKNIDPKKSIHSYLMTMVKNACLDYLKHQLVEEKYVNEIKKTDTQNLYYFDFLSDTSHPTIEEELHQSIKAVSATMPKKCRTIFSMRWIEGLKNREIADNLKISTTTVEKYLAKGMTHFKKNFKREYVLFLIFI